MMASEINNGQQSHGHPFPLMRQNSFYNSTLKELESQFQNLEKPLVSMNLDELLANVWNTEATQSTGMDIESFLPSSSLQRQPPLTLARALSGKTVNQVWEEIQQGQKKKCGEVIKANGRELTLGEMTLEDFLVQAGLFAEASSPIMGLDSINVVTPENFLQPNTTMSDIATSERKRDLDAIGTGIERRLRRKIKNRESAARSRARKQAYHNELMTKVSRLEEDNLYLKKDKEFEKSIVCEPAREWKYQLRRTSSTSF